MSKSSVHLPAELSRVRYSGRVPLCAVSRIGLEMIAAICHIGEPEEGRRQAADFYAAEIIESHVAEKFSELFGQELGVFFRQLMECERAGLEAGDVIREVIRTKVAELADDSEQSGALRLRAYLQAIDSGVIQ
jgi:hypothetical protein